MNIRTSLLLILIFSCGILFSSCFKEELPYPLPDKQLISEGIKEDQVHQGEDYGTEIYYSFKNGIVKTGDRTIWDLAFSCDPDSNEVWLNGGKSILIYPTGNSSLSAVTDISTLSSIKWLYDNPSGIKGQSALGFLDINNHLNEVLVINAGNDIYYKFIIKSISNDKYEIEFCYLEELFAHSYTLEKDAKFNFTYFSFETGIVQPEPPKSEWDILFTRYRHIYFGFNTDGSDMLYPVTGVLTNPFSTLAGEDSTKGYDFNTFGIEDAQTFSLTPNRDIIGFDWKVVDITTSTYTTQTDKVFVIQDSDRNLWKLHFIDYYDNNGVRGSPKFRYELLQ